MLKFRGFYFAPDETGGAGGGGGETPPPNGTETKPDGTKPGTGADNSGTGDGSSKPGEAQDDPGSGGGKGGKPKVEFTPEQQEVFDREIKAAQARGKKAAEDAAKNAKALEEGRYKEVLEPLQKEVEEVYKPAVERAKRLADRLNGTIDAEVEKWPDSVKKTDPGKEDVEKRLTWLENHRQLAADVAKIHQAPEGEHGGGSSTTPTGQNGVSGVMRSYRKPGAAKK